MKIIVTGGAGFIGSAFVRLVLGNGSGHSVINLDKLTYAGNLDNVAEVSSLPNYRFVQADICDARAVESLVGEERPDAIVHFAAESHVDRCIHSPSPSFETNLSGCFTLLEWARRGAVPWPDLRPKWR